MKHSKMMLIVILGLLITSVSGGVGAQDTDFTVGIFHLRSVLGIESAEPFKLTMAELGYVEGENITYLYDDTLAYAGELEQTQIDAAVQVLLDANLDVLFVPDGADLPLFQEVASDIPIVSASISDPIGTGYAESLKNPGGNITGIETPLFQDRRLQLLIEIDPTIKKLYCPYNPENAEAETMLESLMETARELNVELAIVEITDAESRQAAIDNIPEDIDAIFLTPGEIVLYPISEWINLSVLNQKGISVPFYMLVQPEILMGYGVSSESLAQQSAQIVDRILRGASPADLPIESSEQFLAVNLEAAQMLGIEIPRGILRQADTVFRPGDLVDIVNESEEDTSESTPEATP